MGGDDTDLKGMPAEVIPLAKPAQPEPTAQPAVTYDTAESQRKPQTQAIDESEGTGDQLDKPRGKPNQPLPKVRGPIQFDCLKRPSLPSLHPSGDRPLKRLLNMLTGQHPKSSKPAEDSGGETDAAADSGDSEPAA